MGLLCPSAQAGEYVVFSSGLRMHVDRHEVSGGVARLYCKGGVTELPAASIASYEKDDYAPSAASTKPDPPKARAASAINPPAAIRAAALQAGLPAAFVKSVAKVESGFDPNAISRKGAIGTMQLMPATAQMLGADPRDPRQNIAAGARLLRELLLKYNGDVVKALAAYNAGPAAVDRYQGVPPYPETQRYVNKVVREYIRNGGK
ncbi:MAG TPA: lytic transglycosylase domain-containing protein [Bryobacteraceae bacterium]|nr:lytic transglycosylase domain-containing protein [Bryobacteraceae bacterium]